MSTVGWCNPIDRTITTYFSIKKSIKTKKKPKWSYLRRNGLGPSWACARNILFERIHPENRNHRWLRSAVRGLPGHHYNPNYSSTIDKLIAGQLLPLLPTLQPVLPFCSNCFPPLAKLCSARVDKHCVFCLDQSRTGASNVKNGVHRTTVPSIKLIWW